MKQKSKALVLKNTKYKEADLLVSVLTSKGESLRLRAPSALKSKKRFYPGTLEPTHYIAFTYQNPTAPHWPLLLEAKVLEDFALLRQNFERLQTALHFVHLVERVSATGAMQGVEMFNLLGHALRIAQSSSQLKVLKLQFELKFLYLQGVLPATAEAEVFLQAPLMEHEKLEPQTLACDLQNQLATQIKEYVGL